MSALLDAAKAAASAAEEVIRSYYKTELDVEVKSDNSPVTQADIESEAAIKKVLSAAFPDHGFFGEELGQESMDADYIWLIDPIDGTKSFVRRYPFFSTQIALMYKGELILGVSNAPAFNGMQGEMAWAAKGEGAFLNGDAIKVSDIAELGQSTLSTGNIGTLAQSSRWAGLGELITKVHRIRGYGDFYHYHLLASGRIDVIVESDVNILDIAALTVILREAGGDITNLDGGPVGLDTTSVLATNGRLRGDVVSILG